MRLSKAFIPTLKEDPSDAQIVSHVYMVRGGYIRKVAAGIYNFLPLGWRVVRKIEAIVREEMDRTGAQELRMPASIPSELWNESGRWDKYGPELLRFKDRKGADFCVGPTTKKSSSTSFEKRSIRIENCQPIFIKYKPSLETRCDLGQGLCAVASSS